MKKLILIFAIQMLCVASYAQITLNSYGNKAKHSNTLIYAHENVSKTKGFHAMLDFGVGPHVYSASHKGPALTASANGFYETGFGLLAGATVGWSCWQYKNYENKYKPLSDFRLMALLGYVYNIEDTGSGVFILCQPGFSCGQSEKIAFSGDVKVGYRYMFSKHLGLAASIGISGILGDWLAVPFTVGIVF
ncbi:MAG: hypothetical protein MJY55_01755 [Bacteroidales bacterium]|nr:hypothetical protein [Bacteroidales bacterium]